jgi:hypothetical protein
MSDRYRKEIEEILERVNEKRTPSANARPSQQPPRRSESTPRRPQPRRAGPSSPLITPGRLFLAGIVLLLAALVLNGTTLGAYAGILTWIGIALFVIAYVRYFTAPRRDSERRWRGQSIEDPQPEGPLVRFWRWLNRK